jgi:hypothetical protein
MAAATECTVDEDAIRAIALDCKCVDRFLQQHRPVLQSLHRFTHRFTG